MAICVLGSLLVLKYDQFVDAVYEVPWYSMSVENQKKFLYILMMYQKRKKITFWDLAEVNVETFLEAS